MICPHCDKETDKLPGYRDNVAPPSISCAECGDVQYEGKIEHLKHCSKHWSKKNMKSNNGWTKVKDFFRGLGMLTFIGAVLFFLFPGVAYIGSILCDFWKIEQPIHSIDRTVCHWGFGALHIAIPFVLYGLGKACIGIGKEMRNG